MNSKSSNPMGEVVVKQPGLFSTIQDFGRFGSRKYGVPESGIMDRYAFKICNLILGNSENDAVLEITFVGPVLEFNAATNICIGGANLSPKINDLKIDLNTAYQIKAGDILSFGKRKSGFRSYLAIKNGFQSPEILGSRSWFEAVTGNHRLQKNQLLLYQASEAIKSFSHSAIQVDTDYLNSEMIETYEGPEFGKLPESLQKLIFQKKFKVHGDSNRMAVQFEESIQNDLKGIHTSPVMPGSVQLTPSGKLIVLMRDCQTTGGYPRVLQLSEYGIQVLSQKIPGEAVQFYRKR
ncbi:biotin-dependent carboxyltransferase family protein [uncultured Christiangramia sp.]|uniref:5-oxoprolinase subunit C family protein n=1 Tax=uncultured Christiangramia sp. TaxID=503836 RepID=UPI0026252F40|nr:biotin-dependent carboxyltransferase family protein [uncultured Christiangramia sp.]